MTPEEPTEEIRQMMAEDLALMGKSLTELSLDATDDALTVLMPAHKRQRFRKALGAARLGILQAMDALMPNESPTTEHLTDCLIERIEKLRPEELEKIKLRLRAAFGPKTEAKNGVKP